MFGLFLASLFVCYYVGNLWIAVALISFDVYLFHNDDKSLWYSVTLQIILGMLTGYRLLFLRKTPNVIHTLSASLDRYILAVTAAILFGVVYPIKIDSSDWPDIGRLATLLLVGVFGVAESVVTRQTCFALIWIPALAILLDCLIFPSSSNERMICGVGTAIYVVQSLFEFISIKNA